MPLITLSVLDHKPDIAVLCEFRSHTGGQIAGVLADHGLHHQAVSEAEAGTNGVLLASRLPIRRRGVKGDVTTRRRVVEAEVPELGLLVAGVHAPCAGPGSGREAVFARVVETARLERDRGCLVIGDFNSHRDAGKDGRKSRCVHLGRLAALGFRDVLAPEGHAAEPTWTGAMGRSGRIDTALVSGPLLGRVRGCRYSHLERTAAISDHSVTILDLD